MRFKPAMLAGVAVAAVAAGIPLATPAFADPIPVAATYADLLEPVPGAMERLSQDDANRAETARLQPAQVWVGVGPRYHHHHHHHHHHHSSRWYYDHGYYWSGGIWILRPRHHHHHHHHHHHWRGY